MHEKMTLDMLMEDSVSVLKQKYLLVDGEEYPVGEPQRRAYVNSLAGRHKVDEELPEAQRTAIFAVWGDTPIVGDSITEENTQ